MGFLPSIENIDNDTKKVVSKKNESLSINEGNSATTAIRIDCIDGHTAGNPIRLIVGGIPEVAQSSLEDLLKWLDTGGKSVATALVAEPRGNPQMVVAAIGSSQRRDCDAAVAFLDSNGYMPMCIHGLIGVVTFATQHGLLSPREPGRIVFETQAGLVLATYTLADDLVQNVTITNVDSFVMDRQISVVLKDMGEISVDVAFGGNIYAIVEPQENYPDLENFSAQEIISHSIQLRKELNALKQFKHPDIPSVEGVTHLMWTGTPKTAGSHGRNVVFYGQEALDRSPCGTGTSARLAQLHARGDVCVGEEFIHESLIGTIFRGSIEAERQTNFGVVIRPRITGSAFETGHNSFVFDSRDHLTYGFWLTDHVAEQ